VPVIFHIASASDAERARAGTYAPPSLAREGFIHCSTAEQVARVANAFFAGLRDPAVLCIDSTGLDVRWEGADGDAFPHLYGPLEPGAVLGVVDLPTRDGRLVFPEAASIIARRPPATFDDVRAFVEPVMHGFEAPWWIAGGWAVDLALGRVTRAHGDVDVAVRFGDQEAVRAHLDGWDLRVPYAGGPFARWAPGEMLELPVKHQIWARRPPGDGLTWEEYAADPSFIEFLFEQVDGESWTFRREPAVRRPVAGYGTRSLGLPCVRLEVSLLYKAKAPIVAKNQADFDSSLPALDDGARAWLREAVARSHAGHPWIERLS
jgi:uncharacterized protein (DUF952 family)